MTCKKLEKYPRDQVGNFSEEDLTSFEPIDFELWAVFIRNKRKKMGYISVVDFVKSVFLRTRVYIKEQSYYKIEQGRQKPTTIQFFALNLVIFGTVYPPEDILGYIVSDEWKEIMRRMTGELVDGNTYLVPNKWAEENYEKCIANKSIDSDFSKENIRLFEDHTFDLNFGD